MSEADAAYLAGIVDGEGSIILYRRSYGASLRIMVANTDRRLLDWCTRTTGVGSVMWRTPTSPKHSPGGQWIANAQAAESVIAALAPYLVIKGAQAALALDFQQRLRIPALKADGDWQEEYRLRMRAMNQRGPGV